MNDSAGFPPNAALDPVALQIVAAFHESLIGPPAGPPQFDRTFASIAAALRQSIGARHVTLWIPGPPNESPAGSGVGSGAAQEAADPSLRLTPAFSTLDGQWSGHIPLDLDAAGTNLGRCFADGAAGWSDGADATDPLERELLDGERLGGMWLIPLRPPSQRLDDAARNPHNVIAIAMVHFDDVAAARLPERLFGLFGRLCGQAIERALWREQDLILQKSYEALDDVAIDRFAAMSAVARVMAECMQFEACSILQADEPRRVVYVLGTTGIEARVPLRRMQYPYGVSCTGWVAQERRTLATEDLTSAPQHGAVNFPERLATPDMRQYIGTPLLSNAGDLLGVIRLRNKLPPAGAAWPRRLNHLDRVRVERAAPLIAPLMALLIKERQIAATMERVQHDLTMPAMAIRDTAGVLLREPASVFTDNFDRVRQKLEDIESFGEVLLLNSELLSMGPDSELTLRCENVLPLAGFIAKMCKMLAPEARRRGLSGILYNQASFMAIRALWIDPQLLQIALYNLLQNALKYGNRGTVVTIEGEATRMDGELWYQIHVKNQGIGVTPEEAPLVFNRHYRSTRAKRRSETGLGLGLATAREIVQRHGGRLVLTRGGDPTIFSMQLPGWLADRRPA